MQIDGYFLNGQQTAILRSLQQPPENALQGPIVQVSLAGYMRAVEDARAVRDKHYDTYTAPQRTEIPPEDAATPTEQYGERLGKIRESLAAQINKLKDQYNGFQIDLHYYQELADGKNGLNGVSPATVQAKLTQVTEQFKLFKESSIQVLGEALSTAKDAVLTAHQEFGDGPGHMDAAGESGTLPHTLQELHFAPETLLEDIERAESILQTGFEADLEEARSRTEP